MVVVQSFSESKPQRLVLCPGHTSDTTTKSEDLDFVAWPSGSFLIRVESDLCDPCRQVPTVSDRAVTMPWSRRNGFAGYKSQDMIFKIHIGNNCASSAPKPRARLSEAQVIAIFKARASASSSTKEAMVYGVSEKAVRDIRLERTYMVKRNMDPSRPLQLKLAGRPKGYKDAKTDDQERNEKTSHQHRLSRPLKRPEPSAR